MLSVVEMLVYDPSLVLDPVAVLPLTRPQRLLSDWFQSPHPFCCSPSLFEWHPRHPFSLLKRLMMIHTFPFPGYDEDSSE